MGVWGCPWAPSARNGLHRPVVPFSAAPFSAILASKGAQKAPKMEQTSIKKSFKNRSTFLVEFGSDSESFAHDFCLLFETLDLQKWAFGVGEVLFFRNSHFFDQSHIWTDFWMILGGFGDHFGSQNQLKMVSKIDQKIDGFLDRSWKGSGPPKEVRPGLYREGGGPRRGVGER